MALAVARARAVALTAVARARAARRCARSPSRCCCSRSLDPSLVREDRRPLKDVVAVVVDQSGSQTRSASGRARPTQARAELEKRLAALDNVEARFVETRASDPDNQGTQLFAALRSALDDAPPERVGGAILVTDGIVHDIPASPPRSASTRRCTRSSPAMKASATGASSWSRRRASASSARTRRSARACRHRRQGRAGDADGAPRRRDDRDADAPRSARPFRRQGADRPRRPQRRRTRSRAGARTN